jgi:hypothetical protein
MLFIESKVSKNDVHNMYGINLMAAKLYKMFSVKSTESVVKNRVFLIDIEQFQTATLRICLSNADMICPTPLFSIDWTPPSYRQMG